MSRPVGFQSSHKAERSGARRFAGVAARSLNALRERPSDVPRSPVRVLFVKV
jgi:hypothetical protein